MAHTRNKGVSNRCISRRTFNKAVLGAGAAVATGRALSGCSSSSTPPPPSPQKETQTLHLDLSGHPENSSFEISTLGRRYQVVPHTAETLKRTFLANPGLSATYQIPTHFAPDVELSAESPHLLSVTTTHPERGPGLVLAAFHIPIDARARVQVPVAAKANLQVCAAANPVCSMQDQVPDEFITAFDAAKAIVMHHPEIINLNGDIAALVEAHIGNSADVMNLAQSICAQGPAYEHDDKYEDGWCVLVPFKNDDGTPKLDRFGNQIFDYRFSARTGEDLKPAVQDVLSRIKNDPALKDKMYAVRLHGSTEDDSLAAKIAARYQLWKSGGVDIAATNTGWVHNVEFRKPTYTGTGSTRSLSLEIVNMNFIWYGVYVEYLDAAGKPLTMNSFGSLMAPPLTPDDIQTLLWLESATMKWENIIGSPPTIFGIAVFQWPTEIDVTMPEGASSVRVMLCGPGAFGKVDYGGSLVVGILLTFILQYALLVYFIYSGKGVNEDGSLWGYFKANPGVLVKVVAVAVTSLRQVINPSSANDTAMKGSMLTLLATAIEEVIILITKGALPKLSEWVAEKTAQEEAEDATPFVGWVVRIVTLTGTLRDLKITSTEISSNPLVIENVISFTASVEVTVNCDPGNYQFPEEATYYEVQFTVTGAHYPANPQGFDLYASVRSQRSFTVTMDGVPTTGMTDDAVDIWFYSGRDKKWLAGHGKATFENQPSSSDTINATVTIEQNPIPLKATTVYSQKRKLEYSGGRYVWNENPATLAKPAIEPFACGTGLCELTGISVWVPGGMLGYTWQAGGRYWVKNINAQEADPNPGMKYLASGIGAPTPVAYDKTAPYNSAGMTGNHFYLDPVDISVDTSDYQLRRLSLDPKAGVFKTNESWGRFALQLDRLAVHPLGYVIGISANNHKMGVLTLPKQAYPDDQHANNAVLKLGYGDTEKLVKKPQALTVSRTGAILILQGETSISIKAFDVSGNPWPFFNNGKDSSFPLDERDAKWLDIAIDDTEMLYILSYTGSGSMQDDYRLDVYDKSGTRIFRNTGISVTRMVVDKWRRLYSLNQETMKGSPIVEPTVSVWMPSIPPA